MDRTIAEVAGQNGGWYPKDLHCKVDPSSTAAYRITHVRRLEALRRAGLVERTGDGIWRVPEDYLRKTASFEQGRAGLDVEVRSFVPMEDQITRRGLTWLDEHGTAGSGERLASARRARMIWLREQGLLHAGETELSCDRRAELARAEASRAGARLAGQTGRQVVHLQPGDAFDRRYEGAVDLGNRRLAVIGNAKEFVLVPWRAGIERHRGREMVAHRTARGLSWTIGIGRDRGLSR